MPWWLVVAFICTLAVCIVGAVVDPCWQWALALSLAAFLGVVLIAGGAL
jgi:hypothetical protein